MSKNKETMVEPNPFFPPEGVPLLPPEEIARRAVKLKNEILNIWRKRIKVGDAIFIQTSSSSIEGVVEEIDFHNCLLGLRIPSGVVWIGLRDVIYVQILCKKISSCDMKETGSPTTDLGETKCENKSLIWTKVSVGDPVRVVVSSSITFEAVVVEINWKYGFVGLSSVSGITYIPVDLPIALEKLCKKRPKKSKSIDSWK